jgi:hypothetical protein
MEMQHKTETTIMLTPGDVAQIVKEYLENQGHTVSFMCPKVTFNYDMGYDTHEFDGFKVIVDVSEKTVTL